MKKILLFIVLTTIINVVTHAQEKSTKGCSARVWKSQIVTMYVNDNKALYDFTDECSDNQYSLSYYKIWEPDHTGTLLERSEDGECNYIPDYLTIFANNLNWYIKEIELEITNHPKSSCSGHLYKKAYLVNNTKPEFDIDMTQMPNSFCTTSTKKSNITIYFKATNGSTNKLKDLTITYGTQEVKLTHPESFNWNDYGFTYTPANKKFFIKIYLDNGTIKTYEFDLSSSSPVTPGISGTSPVCSGTAYTYTMSSSNALTYDWSYTIDRGGASYVESMTKNGNSCDYVFKNYDKNTSIIAHAYNGCGSSYSSKTIDINILPLRGSAPIIYDGEINTCNTGQISFGLTSTIYNATGYVWYAKYNSDGSDVGTITTNGWLHNIDQSKYGAASVTYSGVNACGTGPQSPIKAVYIHDVPEKPGDIYPKYTYTSYCVGESYIFKTDAVANATGGYDWVVSGLGTGGSYSTKENEVTVLIGSGSTSFSMFVRGKSSVCGYGPYSNEKTINITQPYNQPTMPSGSNSFCQGTESTSFSSTQGQGATIWSWRVDPENSSIYIDNGSTNYPSIRWDPSFSGNVNLYAGVINGCNIKTESLPLAITIGPKPGKPGKPSGTSSVCSGGSYTYTATESSNAISYIWYLSTSSAGTITSQTNNSCTVSWNGVYSGTCDLYIRAFNDCESGGIESEHLTVSIAAAPEMPEMYDIDYVYVNGTSYSYAYVRGDGASSYQWQYTGDLMWLDQGPDWIKVGGSLDGRYIRARAIGCVNSDWTPYEYIYGPKSATTQPINTITGETSFCQGELSKIYYLSDKNNWIQWYETTFSNDTIVESIEYLSDKQDSIMVNFKDLPDENFVLSMKPYNNYRGYITKTLDIDINPRPNKPTISGDSLLCQGNEGLIYSAVSNEAISYNWELFPSEAGSFTNGLQEIEIDLDPDYTGMAILKANGTNSCGSGNVKDKIVYIQRAPEEPPSEPNGVINVCQGSKGVFYLSGVINYADYYDWELVPFNAGQINFDSSQYITIDFDSLYTSDVKLKVRGLACRAGEFSDELDINIIPRVGKAYKPAGEYQICQDSPDVTYSTLSLANADDYMWYLLPENAGYVYGNSTSGTVNWSEDFSDTAYIFVQGSNECGTGSNSDTLIIFMKPLPSIPNKPVGLDDICQSGSTLDFTTNKADNVTTYNWSVYPDDAGTLTGNDTLSTLTINEDYFGNANISVSGTNSCGESENSINKIIYIKPLPKIPTIPFGQNPICQNQDTTMYATAGSIFSEGYQFDVQPASEAYFYNIENILYLKKDPDYVGNYQIKVRGHSCDYGDWSPVLTVSVDPTVSKPSIPKGANDICQNSENQVYTVNEVADADDYSWKIIPSNAGVIYYSGTTGEVDWNSSFKDTARITVQAENNCGTGDWSDTLIVVVKPLPSALTEPDGLDYICQGQQDVSYTTEPGENITSYNWVIEPSTAAYLDVDNEQVSVDYSQIITGRVYLKVAGINECGEGSFSPQKEINVMAAPNVYFTNEFSDMCPESERIILTGGVPAGGKYYVDGNEKYIFYPDKEGRGTHSISYEYFNQYGCPGYAFEEILVRNVLSDFKANIREVEPGGRIDFLNQSINSSLWQWNYGDGSYGSFKEDPFHYYYAPGKYSVTLIATDELGCKDTLVKNDYITVKAFNGVNYLTGLGMFLYPNPVSDILFIDASSYQDDNLIKIDVIEASGRVILNRMLEPGRVNHIDMNNVSEGVYFININVNDISKTVKIIKK